MKLGQQLANALDRALAPDPIRSHTPFARQTAAQQRETLKAVFAARFGEGKLKATLARVPKVFVVQRLCEHLLGVEGAKTGLELEAAAKSAPPSATMREAWQGVWKPSAEKTAPPATTTKAPPAANAPAKPEPSAPTPPKDKPSQPPTDAPEYTAAQRKQLVSFFGVPSWGRSAAEIDSMIARELALFRKQPVGTGLDRAVRAGREAKLAEIFGQ